MTGLDKYKIKDIWSDCWQLFLHWGNQRKTRQKKKKQKKHRHTQCLKKQHAFDLLSIFQIKSRVLFWILKEHRAISLSLAAVLPPRPLLLQQQVGTLFYDLRNYTMFSFRPWRSGNVNVCFGLPVFLAVLYNVWKLALLTTATTASVTVALKHAFTLQATHATASQKPIHFPWDVCWCWPQSLCFLYFRLQKSWLWSNLSASCFATHLSTSATALAPQQSITKLIQSFTL